MADNPPRVVRTDACCGSVPHCTASTGVAGLIPPAIKRSAIRCLWAAPIRTTIVPPTAARASQFVLPSAGAVPTERCLLYTSRCV